MSQITEMISTFSREIGQDDREMLQKLAGTALNSKVLSSNRELFARLAVKYVCIRCM